MRNTGTVRSTESTYKDSSSFYIPNFLTQQTLRMLFTSIGTDTNYPPIVEQIVDMPVYFFVLPQMPFNPAFQVILGASNIDIKTPWKSKVAQTSNLYSMFFNEFNGKVIYTFIQNKPCSNAMFRKSKRIKLNGIVDR